MPNFRLGSGPNGTSTPEAVKAHPFFEGIDWQKLDGLKYRPPFVPQVAHMFDVRNIDPQFVNEPIPQSVLDDGLLRGLAGESALSGARAQPPPPPRQKHSLQQFEVEVTGISSAAAASIASPLSPELASPLSPDLASPLSKNKLETTTSTGKMPTAFKDSFKGFSFAGDGGNWLAVRDEER